MQIAYAVEIVILTSLVSLIAFVEFVVKNIIILHIIFYIKHFYLFFI